jgi:hypothetical protein
VWSSGRRASETMTCHTVVLSDISAKTAASVIVSGGTEGAMITQIEDLPPGVVGFEVRGTLHAADYRDVVLPAVERAGEVGEIRFLIVIPDFKGMSGGAVWEDLKIGLQHLRSWRRIALVTDIEWMSHLTLLFGWMTPGEVKVFGMEDRTDAVAWVAS